ncbi:HlyD family type I secretion periplasmic adaptor subunit [Pseudomaricurvus alkylphenolicus]|uniref:HlyD family type I secretion periplasmic adaptor subunit n=1 Tax=Pseudomaricurvus alkylphenolicus TaxID=1306991 RepID=UPI00198210D9|nr:HlyD family type I secretion periplasmic adaptor subunit [Pseudomaricurvus alkylphenolicus]
MTEKSQGAVNDAPDAEESKSTLPEALDAKAEPGTDAAKEGGPDLAQFDTEQPIDEEAADNLDAETDFSKPRRVGMVLFILVFGVFGLWSVIAPLESAALAPGIVAVKSHKKTVQHLEGGIVKSINIRNGDLVEAEDVLIVLDETQSRAQLEIIRGQYIAFKAKESRLLAERDNRNLVDYPQDLTSLEDTRVQEEVASQNQLFQARRSSKIGEMSVLEQRIEQLQTSVKGLEALKDSKEELVVSYGEELSDFRDLLDEGYADKIRVRELERSHARLKGEVAELISNISATEVQIGETKLNILQLDKDFHRNVVDELAEVQTSLNDTEERMNALLDTVERTEIRAPAKGIVHGLQVHTLGAVLSPGTPILDIVPQSDILVVEAQVAPIDIDRVFIGQDAKIRFSAFKSATTQVISAELISLSADRIIDEQTGMPHYLARVEVTDIGLKELGDLELLPGMPAEVLINTGSRTLLEYLTQPITDAMARSMIED